MGGLLPLIIKYIDSKVKVILDDLDIILLQLKVRKRKDRLKDYKDDLKFRNS